ncbi:hypothetical protein RND71_006355 [Anisodus tanguticus]|uniref:Uncharacterized protein n=1 Tax=Anisodus tanguticus TaxID=243964 RepID=A0AAE1SU38_9SOLA|nr:hypothetical protein RND71_006355 [Anisodus tanguticus]
MKQWQELQDEGDLETHKAVAQPFKYGHSSSRRNTAEFDTHCHNLKSMPSRLARCPPEKFRVQATGTLGLKLEMELMLDHALTAVDEPIENNGMKREIRQIKLVSPLV